MYFLLFYIWHCSILLHRHNTIITLNFNWTSKTFFDWEVFQQNINSHTQNKYKDMASYIGTQSQIVKTNCLFPNTRTKMVPWYFSIRFTPYWPNWFMKYIQFKNKKSTSFNQMWRFWHILTHFVYYGGPKIFKKCI